MSYPLKVLDKLRTCIKQSRAALRKHEQDMDSQSSLCTLKTVDTLTCTWSTTAPGQMEHADASPSMRSPADHIAFRFGLVTQQGGTTGLSSSILVHTPAGSSTLRWQEQIGTNTLEHAGHLGRETSRTMEALFGTCSSTSPCEDCSRTTDGHKDATSLCSGKTNPREARGRKKAHTEESLYKVLISNPVSPLTSITRTPLWLESPDLRFIRLDDKRLQRAIQVLNEQMCNWTTLDYISLYSNTCPLFDAPHGNISSYYMDVTSPFQAIVHLLEYQFGDQVPVFIQDLYNLVERRNPRKKLHRSCVSPSAGKNFFFDAIVSFYINRGTIHNFNRYSSVPLQDAVGKRLLVWNEPNCESAAFEAIKKIVGDDVDIVSVKYSPDMIVTQTRVILLSNSHTFPRDEAFNHRIFRYNWTACPALKMYDEKVHPLAIINLFDKYLDDEEYRIQRDLVQ
ncbi:unnamed protein product [Ixodes pacificus]